MTILNIDDSLNYDQVGDLVEKIEAGFDPDNSLFDEQRLLGEPLQLHPLLLKAVSTDGISNVGRTDLERSFLGILTSMLRYRLGDPLDGSRKTALQEMNEHIASFRNSLLEPSEPGDTILLDSEDADRVINWLRHTINAAIDKKYAKGQVFNLSEAMEIVDVMRQDGIPGIDLSSVNTNETSVDFIVAYVASHFSHPTHSPETIKAELKRSEDAFADSLGFGERNPALVAAEIDKVKNVVKEQLRLTVGPIGQSLV